MYSLILVKSLVLLHLLRYLSLECIGYAHKNLLHINGQESEVC